jgi:hypothetical protein
MASTHLLLRMMCLTNPRQCSEAKRVAAGVGEWGGGAKGVSIYMARVEMQADWEMGMGKGQCQAGQHSPPQWDVLDI